MKDVAILGATSHIAKNLVLGFCSDPDIRLHLFARSVEKVNAFLGDIRNTSAVSVGSFGSFPERKYDVILNCVGPGSPDKVLSAGAGIFQVNDTYDDLALKYLDENPSCQYIYFSSGAVYGKQFEKPANERTISPLDMNHLEARDFYSLAKIHSEAKHRARPDKHIVDIRVFAFFSRYIDLNERYFISEALRCLISKKTFVTTPVNMVRDYIHPADLYRLVGKVISHPELNAALDAYSLKPASKFEILDRLKEEYKLDVSIEDHAPIVDSSGIKNFYYSENRKAAETGYQPAFTSLDAVLEETKALIEAADRRKDNPIPGVKHETH